jgi:hypothetical protein
MLVMAVATVVVTPEDGYDAETNAREIVGKIGPDTTVERVTLMATFDVDGEKHAVLRAVLGGRDIYIMGRDAPWGFSDRTDLPPHVAYRLHIGQVLRAEPDPDQAHPTAQHE